MPTVEPWRDGDGNPISPRQILETAIWIVQDLPAYKVMNSPCFAYLPQAVELFRDLAEGMK